MLVHHADTEAIRRHRIPDLDRLVAEDDLARVRLLQSVEELHQGRFAGAVLANDGMDLVVLYREVDAVIGENAAGWIPLRDAAHSQVRHARLPAGWGGRAGRCPPLQGPPPS
jgi:hypothetical protein